MSLSRRSFLRTAGAAALGFSGLSRTLSANPVHSTRPSWGPGLGPLVEDPDGLLDLPRGFTYRVVSVGGDAMDDGFRVPVDHDGMAAFPGPDGRTLLVRNHEVGPEGDPEDGAFGGDHAALDRLDARRLFDPGVGEAGPALGGTTTLLYDTREQALVEHRLSLAGTLRNCAGGPTPWGTWITCEETVQPADGRWARSHGYAFEVPASLADGPVHPEPLRAMGRFYREAVAVQPDTGIVYQTEDLDDGLLYRFLPDVPGRLSEGGRLQALAVVGRPALRTQNWGGGPRIARGSSMPVRWVDLDDPENPDDDLRERGSDRGAARFARAEGIWYADDGVYIACTNGGRARRGQIWRYRPSPAEGGAAEGRTPGRLELFLEADRTSLLRRADNLTMAPWGDLVVCEDGSGTDRLVGVTPEGDQYLVARNARSSGELAGSTFSPDGTTLFANLQAEALTVAITGPWSRAST